MKRSETAKLLAKAALIDNRTVDDMTVEAWWEALQGVDPRDAFAALALHRQRSTEWVQPAHIVSLAREARRDRERAEAVEAARRALPPPPIRPAPVWFTEFRANLGKGPYSTQSARNGHLDPEAPVSASEASQKAAEA